MVVQIGQNGGREPIDPSQQVVRRDHLIEAKLVKELPLISVLPPHHRRLSYRLLSRNHCSLGSSSPFSTASTLNGHLTQKHLTPHSSNLLSNKILMGMGSPETAVRLMAPTRRRASVGACLLPAAPEKGRIMAGLPLSLAIAIWFVAALWGVGAAAYYFGYSAEFIWWTLFLGMGVAIAEWRLTKNSGKP